MCLVPFPSSLSLTHQRSVTSCFVDHKLGNVSRWFYKESQRKIFKGKKYWQKYDRSIESKCIFLKQTF